MAILPLGLISVYQTNKVLEDRKEQSKAALLERTQEAASESRELIRAAVGAAETLAVQMPTLLSQAETCATIMSKLVERSESFAFAGYRDNEQGVICASEQFGTDDGNKLDALPALEKNQQEVLMLPLEFLGGIATFSVTVPVVEQGRFLGTVWIVVPVSALNSALSRTGENVDLVLFQNQGEIIATEDFSEERRSVLPADMNLQDLAIIGRQTFRTQNREGQQRDFAVSAILNDRVFALGSWMPQGQGIALPAYQHLLALYFPIAIWIIAIIAAYVGVHRLVIRHLRRLRLWMRAYASDSGANLDKARLRGAPEEIEVLAETLRAMTRRLSEQDRRREEDLQEKTVLLREVHHRVKNNLQLISSMMNMQIRATDSDEAKNVLRRVQDRVMALSAIHRYLYLARKLSMLRADKLLEEIIQQLVIVGTLEESDQKISVSTQLDKVEINPDQSVPLSLLATEAAMNAVKYCGVTSEGEAWVNIALKLQENGDLCLSIVNSCAQADNPETRIESSGLGSRLIRSFATQLNGTLETRDLPNRYELHVVFPLAWHDDSSDD
ncbi:sensor histidine kinase [Roseovarius sp. MMSF_3281]|uniref:sensor histidine kinase n=1 Tax=Roseovarius sp. MMSF_3281 TaxID=3046694 RepID=UPI00273DD9D2|nr:sensor histidine kinase [Roseovarius sp. MMSF_3281]